MTEMLLSPPRLPLVAASILSADFANMGADCRAVLAAGADLLHLDVMDGHFVPNLTMGPAMCRGLRDAIPDAFLGTHLMVSEPAGFVAPFAQAGANLFTFHIEAVNDPPALARTIHAAGMLAGLAINPPTEVTAILPHLDAFDLILVMSVNPGFSGQDFITGVLEKVRRIKPLLRPEQRLQMDGGVNRRTAGACRDAGCDVIVAASAIFKSDDYAAAINALRGDGDETGPVPGRPVAELARRGGETRRGAKKGGV